VFLQTPTLADGLQPHGVAHCEMLAPAWVCAVVEVKSILSVRVHQDVSVAAVSLSSGGGGLAWCAGRELHTM